MPINKFRTQYPTGNNLYVLIYNEDQEVAYIAGEVFETYGTSSRTAADYAVAMTEITGTGYYYASWPSWIERGSYDIVVKIRTGSAAADSDTGFGPVEKYWTGTSVAEDAETSAVAVCNRALAKVGGGEDTLTITVLNDSTNDTTTICYLLYTPARKTVLKRMKPQECLYYAELTASSSTMKKANWDYIFDLPDDCLQVCAQIDEQYHKQIYPHMVKQGYLLTNHYSNEDRDAAYIEYVKNETDASVFSEEVVNAIATLMAADLAPRLIAGEYGWQRRQEFLEEFEKLVLPNAMGINRAQQYHEEKPVESKYGWLADRQFDEDYDYYY